jgi:TRAP-type C4-dicarboxylate transport system permease small subunit
LTLFLQWPLRDLLRAYSREANDLAQWLFALYVSLALTYATRKRTHPAAASVAERYAAPARRRITRAAALLCLVPWSVFVLIAGAPLAWRSILELEQFPDTYNPGYIIIKGCVWLLALLILLQAVLDLLRPTRPP